MTQLQAVAAETCNQFLRQGREFLAQGDLASASAAGWRAAALALEAYTGGALADAEFRDAAHQLVTDQRGYATAAEWVVSAIALSDNTLDDWLDVDGVARRLDDVQRLALLVKDIADPPQTAEDILAQSRECLENGYLVVASEKGWEATTHAAKAYAEAMGCDYHGDRHFESVMRTLEKDDVWREEVEGCEYSALNLRRTAAYCNVYPRRMHPEVPLAESRPASKYFYPSCLHPTILAEDIEAVAQLIAALQAQAKAINCMAVCNV